MSARWTAARLMLRRGRGIGDLLPIIAFAASTAVLAMVLGGVHAFLARSQAVGAGQALEDGSGMSVEQTLLPLLLMCALIAAALLVPSAMGLGSSAARLSLSRRERQLAAVRLVGGTRSQVGLVAVLDVLAQALIGAVAGIGLHLALTPLLTHLDFAITPFRFEELVLPWWGYPILLIGVAAMATVSGALGLLGVTISPLGVARQSRTVRMSVLRVVAWVGLLILFVASSKLLMRIPGLDEAVIMAVIVSFMALVVGAVNLIGPFLVWLVARMVAHVAPTPSLMVGARRLAADPRAGWRSVSGIAFGLVVAGMLTLIASLGIESTDPMSRAAALALQTGGYLTLAISSVLAAVSTGVTQTARLLEQGEVLRSQHVAGATVAQLHRARFAEIGIPVALAGIVAAVSAATLILPFASGVANPLLGIVLYVAASVAALGLVMASVAVSSPMVGRLARAA